MLGGGGALTLPRLAQEAPKNVLRGGAATHKNRVADAILNQNSIHSSSSRALKGKAGCWGGGSSSQSRITASSLWTPISLYKYK